MRNYELSLLSMDDFIPLESRKSFYERVESRTNLSCMSWPNQQRLLYVDNSGLLWGMKDWSTGPPRYYLYRFVDNVTSLSR
jgi:hypothetical protein